MSSEKESSARRHQESADETEIVLPYTHTQLSLLPSPSLGNVFIAVLINNSTPATGEESGVTRERKRDKENKRQREEEGGSLWTC